MDILWHYRFPHDGWEYDQAVTELHASKPENVVDPYTPNGIENPQTSNNITPADAYYMTSTYFPTWFKKEN